MTIVTFFTYPLFHRKVVIMWALANYHAIYRYHSNESELLFKFAFGFVIKLAPLEL